MSSEQGCFLSPQRCMPRGAVVARWLARWCCVSRRSIAWALQPRIPSGGSKPVPAEPKCQSRNELYAAASRGDAQVGETLPTPEMKFCKTSLYHLPSCLRRKDKRAAVAQRGWGRCAASSLCATVASSGRCAPWGGGPLSPEPRDKGETPAGTLGLLQAGLLGEHLE